MRILRLGLTVVVPVLFSQTGTEDLEPTGVIVFQSSRTGSLDIFAMSDDGTAPRRLTTHPGTDHSPALSSDGSTVAFVSDRDESENIYLLALDGGVPLRLTDFTQPEGDPTWSPDGRRVFFQGHRSGDFEVFTVGVDGTDLRALTEN